MIKEIEQKINDNGNNLIMFNKNEKVSIDLTTIEKRYNFPIKGLIDIYKKDCVIDFCNSSLELNLYNFQVHNVSIIYIHPDSTNTTIKNLNIIVNVLDNDIDDGLLVGIYNTSKNFKLINSKISIISKKSHKIIGVYNNGNLFTHMETRADNLLINNSHIEIISTNDKISSEVYGIYNNLANTITVTNNYICTKTIGKSDDQKAIGIYTNGRFGRFIGNNVKANGSHPEGLELEQASAYGFINEGLFNIINANNIIAEWAGKAIAIEVKGNGCIITSNKILATHTLNGKGIVVLANDTIIENNIIISTSLNAKLIELRAGDSIISHNILEVTIPINEVVSGCGIYSPVDNIKNNIITENIISNVHSCGIFINKSSCKVLRDNQVIYLEGKTMCYIGEIDNFELYEILNERHIKTRVRE